jgi:hypothetical protein
MAKLNSKKQKKSLFYKEKSLVGLTPVNKNNIFFPNIESVYRGFRLNLGKWSKTIFGYFLKQLWQ